MIYYQIKMQLTKQCFWCDLLSKQKENKNKNEKEEERKDIKNILKIYTKLYIFLKIIS